MIDKYKIRKSKVVPFIKPLEQDRNTNLKRIIQKAKTLELDGFSAVKWEDSYWTIASGRLTNIIGSNTKYVNLKFCYSKGLGGSALTKDWSDLAKSLVVLRFHKKNQCYASHREFLIAFGYIADAAKKLKQQIKNLTPETLDLACENLKKHYSESTVYKLQNLITEIAAHCDSNGLCQVMLNFKSKNIKRPSKNSSLNRQRLDDPNTMDTNSERLILPEVFKVLGELYRNVPKDHNYRIYILITTLLLWTGRRLSEIILLPHQKIQTDIDGIKYLNYFPLKYSHGNALTPLRRLYLPTISIQIVEEVISELDQLCAQARETAAKMQLTQSADLRFLSGIKKNMRIYTNDLKKLNLPALALEPRGWISKNGHIYRDNSKLNKVGNPPLYPFVYTNKEGVIAYCNKDYHESLIDVIHIDQNKNKYYMKDLMFVKYFEYSSGKYAFWLANKISRSMYYKFMKKLPELASIYAPTIEISKFKSHDFRHTLNTILDEGGLTDLLQSEWFGRSSPEHTKSYQHTTMEKRSLMIRKDIMKGRANGKFVDFLGSIPNNIQKAVLSARVQAVHDVGIGYCIHNFNQTPCQRHMQCAADCSDYIWIDKDKGREEEIKRKLAVAYFTRQTAQKISKTNKPKLSKDWLAHNNKIINTLERQLKNISADNFDVNEYVKGFENE